MSGRTAISAKLVSFGNRKLKCFSYADNDVFFECSEEMWLSIVEIAKVLGTQSLADLQEESEYRLVTTGELKGWSWRIKTYLAFCVDLRQWYTEIPANFQRSIIFRPPAAVDPVMTDWFSDCHEIPSRMKVRHDLLSLVTETNMTTSLADLVVRYLPLPIEGKIIDEINIERGLEPDEMLVAKNTIYLVDSHRLQRWSLTSGRSLPSIELQDENMTFACDPDKDNLIYVYKENELYPQYSGSMEVWQLDRTSQVKVTRSFPFPPHQNRITMRGDFIYSLSTHKHRQFWIHDTNGKFIRKWTCKGMGPQTCYTMTARETIVLVDFWSALLKEYTLKGELINVTAVDACLYATIGVHYWNDELYCIASIDEKTIVRVYGLDGQVRRRFKIPSEGKNLIECSNITEAGQMIVYTTNDRLVLLE